MATGARKNESHYALRFWLNGQRTALMPVAAGKLVPLLLALGLLGRSDNPPPGTAAEV